MNCGSRCFVVTVAQDLYFRSSDSQKPYERWLQPYPLARQLTLLPHRELSEDEGKNNSPPAEADRAEEATRTPRKRRSPQDKRADTLGQPRRLNLSPKRSRRLSPTDPSLAELLFPGEANRKRARGVACCSQAKTGMYRFEDRTQNRQTREHRGHHQGQIKPTNSSQLHELLDDPRSAKIGTTTSRRHGRTHDGRHGGDHCSRPLTGSSISFFPASTEQDSRRFMAATRIRACAMPLRKFLAEHVENNPAGILDPTKRNGCSEAP
jgi:hypothetical protein